MAGMRAQVSKRDLANILSSYAVDMDLATREDPRLLVDHSKVSREQEREMARVISRAEEWMRTAGISAIQFDGKEEKAKAWVNLEVPSSWQCHSQSMERAIRKVSESCLMVVGERNREGWIRCTEESRKVLKKPNTKKDRLSGLS